MSASILQSTPSSKLMQNYREEVPATALGSIVSCVDSSGAINLFTLGSGNAVYCIRQDATSETGWAAPVVTGITGPLFAACPFGSGVAVFGTQSAELMAAVCATPGGSFAPAEVLGFAFVMPVALKAAPYGDEIALFVTVPVPDGPGSDGPFRTTIFTIGSGLAYDTAAAQFDQDAASFDVITTSDGQAIGGIVTPAIYTLASGAPHQVWTSKGADNDYPCDGSFWRTLPTAPYLALGDLAVAGSSFDTPPSGATMARAVSDPAGVIAPPLMPIPADGWHRLWDDRHSDASDDVTVWRADTAARVTPPTASYLALGDAVVGNYDDDDPPPDKAYAWVNTAFLTPGVVSNPAAGCTRSPAELCNNNLLYLIANDDGLTSAAFDAITPTSDGITGRTFYTHTGDLGLPTATRYTLASNPVRPSSVCSWSSSNSYGAGDTPASLGAVSSSAVVAYAWAPDATGVSQLFAVLADGCLYTFAGGTWTQLDGANTYLAVTATQGTGGLEVFALGTNRQLFHLRLTADGWSEPLQLAATASIGSLSVLQDANGAAACFAITSDDQILRIEQDPDSGDWSVAPIELAATGTIAELYTWSVEIVARDDDGNLLAQSPITLWADGVVEATLNGTGSILDPDLPVTAMTNASGVLTIASAASTIASPTFYFQTSSMAADDSAVEVQPNAALQTTLAAAEASDYVANLGLDEDTAAAVAPAVTQIMSFDSGGDAPTLVRPLVGRPRPVPGVRRVERGAKAAARRVRWPAGERVSWELDFTSGTPRFRTLTPAEAAALAEDHERRPKAQGLLSWLSDLGDLIAGLFDGVVQVAKYVATWVGDTLQAAWTIIVNEVEYTFDAIVETLTDAFNTVVAFFAQVGAAFDKLVQWLGFVFDWQDILRTATAINYVLSSVIGGFLTSALPQLQTKVDGWFSQAKDQLATIFQDGQDAIGADGSLATGSDTLVPVPPPALDAVAGTNIVLDGTLNNASDASVDTTSPRAQRRAAARARLRAILGDGTSTLQQFAQDLSDTTAYTDSTSAIDTSSDSGDTNGALGGPLASLLTTVQSLATTALGLAQDSLDDVFETIAAAAGTIFGEDGALETELDIPFVSALYTYVTGQDALTIGGLISLILAIPTTIIYKLGAGAAPFADDAAVTAFQAAITAAGLVSATGLGSSALVGPFAFDPIDPIVAKFFGTLNGAAYLLLGIAAGAADLIPLEAPQSWDPTISMLSLMILFLEWIACVTSCAYLQGATSFEFSCDEVGISNVAWAISAIGPLFDAAAFWSSDSDDELGRIMRNLSSWSIIVDIVFSSLPSLVATVLAGAKTKNTGQMIQGIVLYIPALFHALRIGSTEFNTLQTWLPAGLDLAGNVVAAAIQFWLTWASPQVAGPPDVMRLPAEAGARS